MENRWSDDPSLTYRQEDRSSDIREIVQSASVSHVSKAHNFAVRAALLTAPFLPHNEIRRRRFAEMRLIKNGISTLIKFADVEMNDRWWEWEEELGRKRKAGMGRPLFESTAPQFAAQFAGHADVIRSAARGISVQYSTAKWQCRKCGNRWWQRRKDVKPPRCPQCKTTDY